MADTTITNAEYINKLQNPTTPVIEQETLGQDDFLRLLTTQLMQQDPTKPMDPGQFITDMTQFSNLQAMNDLNANVQAMTQSFLSMQSMQAGGMIGKSVMVEGNQLQFDQTGDLTFEVSADETLIESRAVITNNQGEVVQEFNLNTLSGNRNVTWDGYTREGHMAPEGNYTLTAYGLNSLGEKQIAGTYVASKINSVSINDDKAITLYLQSGESVSMDSVRQILG